MLNPNIRIKRKGTDGVNVYFMVSIELQLVLKACGHFRSFVSYQTAQIGTTQSDFLVCNNNRK